MKLTHASLFSGIGGAELAASWLGWTNVFHCEIQEFQRKVLEYWFPNSISYEDITKTDFSEWRGHIDVLTGGFPCQPFSVAGERKITATSGVKCYELYGRYSPLGLLAKTLMESSQWYSQARRLRWNVQTICSTRISYTERNRNSQLKSSVKTLSEQVIPSNRLLFQLVPSEHPTEETGCGLLQDLMPTPIASDAQGGAAKLTKGKRLRNGKVFSATLKDLVASNMLPTPQTQGLKVCDEKGKTVFMNLDLLSTVTAQVSRGNCSNNRHKSNLTDKIAELMNPTSKTSQLNPLYVTEMMGYPLEWLTLPFLSQSGEAKALKR